MHPAMKQLSQLPLAERLELVQDLWDSIGQSKQELPVQDWHRELAQARLTELEGREKEIGLSGDEVWKRVEQSRGD